MKRKVIPITLLVAALLLSGLLIINAGAVRPTPTPSYWFFSDSPYPDFYNPQDEDPNYVGKGDPCNDDDWFEESILHNIDWESHQGETVTFNFWLGVHPDDADSEDTKVVIAINDDAHDGIKKISVNGDTIDPGDWITDPTSLLTPSGPLSPHGVYKSSEFYGYYIIDVGDIEGSGIGEDVYPELAEIDFVIELENDATNGIKIHLDAFSEDGAGPYSHDANAGYCPGEEGKIKVKKKIDWGYQSQYQNGWKFKFEADWTGDFELEDGESMEWILPPGKYEVAELTPAGWELYEIIVQGTDDYKIDDGSVEVKLEDGDKITIIFVNRPPDFVIPENPLGTLGSALSLFAVLALMYALKRGNVSIVLE